MTFLGIYSPNMHIYHFCGQYLYLYTIYILGAVCTQENSVTYNVFWSAEIRGLKKARKKYCRW